MKKLISYIIGSVLLVAGSTSCSKDYMELRPESSTTADVLFTNEETAQYAVNGLGKLMQTQYWSSQGFNGEGTVMLYGVEMAGMTAGLPSNTGWSNTMCFNYYNSGTSNQMVFPWYYYYKLIGNANIIIQELSATKDACEASGTPFSKGYQYVLAQALCYRAYSYLRMSQFYCRRWSDKNGAQRGLPLRLDTSNDALAASTLADIYKQIYDDLDDAIAYFTESGMSSSQIWKASLETAHAIYSRAALNREDWETCVKHSQLARKGHDLMGDTEYHAGFYQPNKEWIWEAFQDATQNIYYYSYHAYCASNANTSYCRSYSWIIDRLLYESIPEEDTRRDLFMAPTEDELKTAGSANTNYQEVTSSKNKAYYNRIWKDYADKLVKSGSSVSKLFYYSQAKVRIEQGAAYGVGEICLFRSAEMYYNEAEAQFKLSNEAAARTALETAVKPYNAKYSAADLKGQALWDEIVKYRRYDLFLEGHSFLDEKRWNIDHNWRKSWSEGGNWSTALTQVDGGSFKKDEKNNWCIIYPKIETTYNDQVTPFEPEDWQPVPKN